MEVKMPIYEYKCEKCDQIYELFLKLKDIDKEQACSVCGNKLEKLISSSNFVFNGGYTYKNLYGLKDNLKK